MGKNIINISSTLSFVDVLAKKLIDQYKNDEIGLANVIVLMANRREVVSLKNAFVRQQGLSPAILPRIISIGDLEEDEIFLQKEEYIAKDDFVPSINPLERLFLFTKIIVSKPADFGLPSVSFSQAYMLAKELASLIDSIQNEKKDVGALEDLVPEEYSEHWQETLKFLRIITAYWPKILQERKVCDVVEKYNSLLAAKSTLWNKTKPSDHIVAAGIYADYPEIQNLLKSICDLENGEIYINGLDRYLDEESWKSISETHPQYQLKKLLEFLEIERKDVKEFRKSINPQRERFVSEVMRPAKTTGEWLNLAREPFDREATENLHVLECENIQHEAIAISLILREAIEEDGVTAAVVSPDRTLSRMIEAELTRWGIDIDDTAGKPLNQQPTMIFLRQVFAAAQEEYNNVEFLSLLKNPFCRCKMDTFEFNKRVRDYETLILRKKKTELNDSQEDKTITELELWKKEIRQKLFPLTQMLKNPIVNARELIYEHLKTAEELASTKDEDGARILWKGENGKKCAEFFSSIIEQIGIIEQIKTVEYLDFIEALATDISVRKSYGTHPRLKIMGPLESRLNNFDIIVIAGCNEGIWPTTTKADPWMSRGMKYKIGLPLPEKSSGVLAFDFANLLSQKNVYITRAKRVDGAPSNKSRWLLRIETVLQAAKIAQESIFDQTYTKWAKLLDKPEEYKKIKAPMPIPAVKLRPRKLSASGLGDLIDNPYVAYAKYILKLYALNDIDGETNASDFGNIVHKVLEIFCKRYPKELPQNAQEIMLEIGKDVFAEAEIEEKKKRFWEAKFKKMINWAWEEEKKERPFIKNIYSENNGKMQIKLPAGEFVLTSRADRINVLKDGNVSIIDYKTGSFVPTKTAVKAYKAPQLLLEALIAECGGFDSLPSQKVESIKYWKLGDKVIELKDKDLEKMLEDGESVIKSTLEKYDVEGTPYEFNASPKYCKNKDYDHLARISEWGVSVEDNGAEDED